MVSSAGFDGKAFQIRAEEFLQHVLEKTHVPGAAIAVSLEGDRVYAFAGRSKVDVDAPLGEAGRFQLGCLMKLIVSIVALELAARGKLDLFCEIGRYLPELKGSIHGDTVQVAHLLSHTAGYRGLNIFENDAKSMDWARLIEFIRSTPQHFKPGSVYSYEHSETVLAAEIVQRVAGMSILELAREMFLDAIGVELRAPSSQIDSDDVGQHGVDVQSGAYRRVGIKELSPDGKPSFSSLWETSFSVLTITLPEILKIAEFLSGQSISADGRSVTAAPITRNLLQKPAVHMPPQFGASVQELPSESFGLGIARWSNGFYGVAGGVFGQCHGIRFDPARGLAVAVGLNALNPMLRNLIVGRVTEDVAGESFSRSDNSGSSGSEIAAPYPDADVVGLYAGAGSSVLRMEAGEAGLVCRVGEETGKSGELRLDIGYSAGAGYRIVPPIPGMSLGFFREPDHGAMAVVVGQTAFKKVA